MTRLFAAAVALALLAFATGANAAENGNVSSKSLSRMGFASAKTISDADGMHIRGQGRVAIAAGHQVAHGATTASVFNFNTAIINSRGARAYSLGFGIGLSF